MKLTLSTFLLALATASATDKNVNTKSNGKIAKKTTAAMNDEKEKYLRSLQSDMSMPVEGASFEEEATHFGDKFGHWWGHKEEEEETCQEASEDFEGFWLGTDIIDGSNLRLTISNCGEHININSSSCVCPMV